MTSIVNWNQCKPLPRETQVSLAIQAQAGSKVARDQLITSNMKLASRIASQHKSTGNE